jgi:prepilin-type N-terminal cleavage/methylation domain-containing protein
MKRLKINHFGFTLIELMIVVAIIGFLVAISIPSFTRYIAKAKRAEAYMNLGTIYTAEKIYWAEHGHYTTKLSGQGGCGWCPEGYSGGGPKERYHYTYGFAGSEGQHYFTGKLGAGHEALQKAKADTNSFLAIAAADIDGDGKLDIIGINDKHEIIILEDDLT